MIDFNIQWVCPIFLVKGDHTVNDEKLIIVICLHSIVITYLLVDSYNVKTLFIDYKIKYQNYSKIIFTNHFKNDKLTLLT